MPATPAKPVFLDYGKDILKSKLGKAEVLYVPNKDNSIYRLRFRYKTGTLNDLKLPLAAQYIQFLGTDKKSAEQISKEFYKIASSFNISAGEEYTTVMNCVHDAQNTDFSEEDRKLVYANAMALQNLYNKVNRSIDTINKVQALMKKDTIAFNKSKPAKVFYDELQKVKAEFFAWKGRLDQTDDVAMIGFRV